MICIKCKRKIDHSYGAPELIGNYCMACAINNGLTAGQIEKQRYEEIAKQAYELGYKQGVQKMQERVMQAICDNTYPDFNKDGKPINVWKAILGYDAIDQIAKEIEGERDGN